MLCDTACPVLDGSNLSFEYCKFVVMAHPPEPLPSPPTDKILATGLLISLGVSAEALWANIGSKSAISL